MENMENSLLNVENRRLELEKLLDKLDVKNEFRGDRNIILSLVWKVFEKSTLVEKVSETLVDLYTENKNLNEKIEDYKDMISTLKSFVDKMNENN
ncbi:hypothetical protein M0R19_08530 [Candidatus Pacearchaeota archaeon]|jgi:predicted RNase H-like nuclease (RuvC/YqgF family)|nr:hypothetical protein [bacterium]MCK9597203.1 hypothetical protein [Candidatus Pacearchaeota archaeon]